MLKAAPLLSLLGSCRQERGVCLVLAHLAPLLASATVLASGVVGAAGIARPALPGGTGLSPGLPPRVTVT